VVAGLARPDLMRLEGVAPIGPPAFVLVASGGAATLLLPRENAVLRDAPPEQVLEALTGVSLQPADLLAVLTGCVAPGARAVAGRLHAGGRASITLDGGAELYLQQDSGAWRVRAARRDSWIIEYPLWQGMYPSSVRLRSDDARVGVDMTATIAQVEANIDINAEAFQVNVPASARPITLADLRAGGPLRDQP
jgi:hypothetical protein